MICEVKGRKCVGPSKLPAPPLAGQHLSSELMAEGSKLTYAQGGTRTRKTLRSEDFESSASTNSTTWARPII